MRLGSPEILILLIFMGVLFALPLWGIVDAAQRDDTTWRRLGKSKVLWVVLQLPFWPLFVGQIFAVIYLTSVRPRLKEMTDVADATVSNTGA